MKSKSCLVLLLIPALLLSCQEKKNDSSSEDSRLDPSSSAVSSAEDDSSLGKEVVQILNEMKKGNFTLTYHFAGRDLSDVITSNYFYTGYLNNGRFF